MRTVLFGRIVFGAASILLGVIALMWHDADTWQALAAFWKLPLGTLAGECLMIALIIGGIGLLIPQTSRAASVVLVIVYGLFSIVLIAGIIAQPKVFGAYDGFFEQFCLFCGAIAVYAATEPDSARSIAIGRTARLGLGLCAVAFTLAQIIYLQFTASLVPTWIPPDQMFWALLTTLAFALAAIAILINVKARLAIRLMTLMLALFGILVWIPALVAQPGAHGNWSEFAVNFQITGAAWVVAYLKSF